jgi:anti-anti-sigma factor
MSAGVDRAVGFRVTIDLTGGEVQLALVGELDDQSAPELASILDALFERGHDSLTLDLSQLSFMDAHGLGLIAYTARRSRAREGALTLRAPSDEVRQALDLHAVTGSIRLELSDFPLARLGPEQSMTVYAQTAGSVVREARRAGTTSMPVAREVLDDSLRLIVNLAKVSVKGADGVSVSLLRDGEISTVAASDETILEMDAGQYSTGEGPCLAASTEGHWFHISSLQEEERWPEFVPLARSLGIQAILSNPLVADSRPVGALNIYSRTVAAFGLPEEQLASIFAHEASTVLTRVGLGASDEILAQRLHGALQSREVIAQAQGVLMERSNIDEQTAFDRLRRFAQHDDRPLREWAEDIVASTHRPTLDEQETKNGHRD